jgi:GxxExxY protein
MERAQLEKIATGLVDAAYNVHRQLGAGLLESAYHASLFYELRKRGYRVRSEVPVQLFYDGVPLDVTYRIDLLLEDVIVIENKVVMAIHPVHLSQVLTYLRQANLNLGFLINWNAPRLKDGIRRVVNRLEEPTS